MFSKSEEFLKNGIVTGMHNLRVWKWRKYLFVASYVMTPYKLHIMIDLLERDETCLPDFNH